jgi:hypothetical protein
VSLNGQEKEIIMSVWKQVKVDVLNKNVNERLLVQALNDLGIGIDKTVKTIRNSWGHDTCDFVLTNKGKVTSVGMRWTKGKGLELVGDTFCCGFEGVNDKGQEKLMNMIAQAYQVRHIKQQMQLNNWTVESQTTENGQVKLVLVQA